MIQPFVVTPAEAGRTLAAVLKGRLRLSWSQARRLVEHRRVRVAGQGCADPVRRVRAGQRVELVAASADRRRQPPGDTRAPAARKVTRRLTPPVRPVENDMRLACRTMRTMENWNTMKTEP